MKVSDSHAKLFAFRSPLSTGAILADEIGLGKTIEAGIVLSKKWAERKRKLLIILPSSLRKQWGRACCSGVKRKDISKIEMSLNASFLEALFELERVN